jgi:hypothetical protein
MPLDDHDLTLGTKGWKRHSGSAYYQGTVTKSSHHHATLRAAGAITDRIAVLATHCPTCGTLAVYVGPTRVGTVDLRRSRTVPIDGLGLTQT